MTHWRPLVVGLWLFGGCAVDSKPAPKAAAKAKPAHAAAAAANEDDPAQAEPDEAAAQPPDSDLAQRFRDPPWYRKTLFEDATVTDTARSEANEQGLFQSHILFELKDGTSKEGCAEHLEQKVGEFVDNLQRSEQPDGRLKITGSTDRYEVTLLCGEAKGTMRAYVAFEWTS